MEKLQWVKEIFGTKLEIFRKNEVIGTIQWGNMLSSKAQATINGRLFTLTREFFTSKIEIYDTKHQLLLGTIMVNLFNPRTDLVINGKRFELEIKNFWQSRWSWKFNGTEIITYTANEFIIKEKGEIELFTTCNEEVEILLLLGLFVRNQFVLVILFLLILFLIVIL